MIILNLPAFWQETHVMKDRYASDLASPASVSTRLQLRPQLSCWLLVYVRETGMTQQDVCAVEGGTAICGHLLHLPGHAGGLYQLIAPG